MNVYEVDPELRLRLEDMGVVLQHDLDGKVALAHSGFDDVLLKTLREIPELAALIKAGDVESEWNILAAMEANDWRKAFPLRRS